MRGGKKYAILKHALDDSDADGPRITLQETLHYRHVGWGKNPLLFLSDAIPCTKQILNMCSLTWIIPALVNHWENCLGLEAFCRALHTIIYKVMENVHTKPYVLGITTGFSIRCFFNMLIILNCSFSYPVKEASTFYENEIYNVVTSFSINLMHLRNRCFW